jgi:uncharacterized lipoprotein YmbA
LSRALARAAGLVALALLLGSCAGKLPPTHYYTLQPAAGAVAAAQEGSRVGVDTLVVDPPYDQDRLVYRESASATEVGFYNYHRWAAPLSRMLAVSLAAGLEGTPGIAAIEPTQPGTDYDSRLRGRVVALEEVDSPAGAEARIVLDLTLVSADGTELWSSTLTATAGGPVASGADAMGLVQRAFADLARQARGELATALGTAS